MKCPKCGLDNTKVTNVTSKKSRFGIEQFAASKNIKPEWVVARRRKCLNCQHMFTSYECYTKEGE